MERTKLVCIIICSVFCMTTIPSALVNSWGPFSVYLTAPSSAYVYDYDYYETYYLKASCSKTADWIGIFVDGVCVKSGSNTRSVSISNYKFRYIKKLNIRAMAEVDGMMRMKTIVCRTRFHIDDPDSGRNNLGTDQLRNPSSTTVYDVQSKIIQDSGYGKVYTPSDWMNAIWTHLKDYDVAPYYENPDWYSDVEMANDYLDDGVLDNHYYQCSSYSAFITGLARSVGLPSRMWTMVQNWPAPYGETGIIDIFHHIIPEVYIGIDAINDNDNGWWPIDLGQAESTLGGIDRTNWNTPTATFQTMVHAHTYINYPYLYRVVLIWNIFDSLPFTSHEQEKCYLFSGGEDTEFPDGYWFLPNSGWLSSMFYGIKALSS